MRTAVVTFGRMNPPTLGHEQLIQTVKKTAKKEKNARPLVFLSHTQDPKKNPLDYDKKIRYARAAFGDVVRKSKANNPFQMLADVEKIGFDRVVWVAGADRLKEYERILRTYNKKEFSFEDWKVESAGIRDPDEEGVTGVSASKVRDAAVAGDFNLFSRMLPKGLSARERKSLYEDVREGMGVKENLDLDFEVEDSDFEFTDEELDFIVEHLNWDELDEDEEDEEEELEEVLGLKQRRQRGRQMRRRRHKLSRRRKIRRKRKADPERLKKRSRRAARQAVRKRVGGKRGANYGKLSPTQKMAIDKRLKKKKKQIDRLAKRMAPKVRKKERERLRKARSSKKEGYEREMIKRKNINESFDRFYNSLERTSKKVNRSLREKAHQHDIPLSVIRGVYERGLEDFIENGKKTFTESQWAFARVNSFIEGGKACQLDKDLWERVQPLRDIMEKMEMVSEDTAKKVANEVGKKIGAKFSGARDSQTASLEKSSPERVARDLKSLGFTKTDEIPPRLESSGPTIVYERDDGSVARVTERNVMKRGKKMTITTVGVSKRDPKKREDKITTKGPMGGFD